MKKCCFAVFGMAALVTGCLSEPEFEPVSEGAVAINLDGSIVQESTKANAAGFEDGDAIGLYAVNYIDGNQTPGTLLAEGNQADHVKYVFNEKEWKWTPVRPVYYKDVNTNVDLYAFYPHAEPDDVEAWNFEVQKDQSTARTTSSLGGYEASDFLWGKTENVVPTEAKIKISLKHKMAGAEVILQQGEGFAEGEFESLERYVLTTGTTRKASINLSTGEVTPIGSAQATGIVMSPQSDGSFRSIVVPQTVEAGVQLFSITIDGQAYGFKRDADFTYESGKVSKFTIKVNRKTPSGEYELEFADVQIVPWVEDRNTHEAEARQYYVVNVETPGTLGRLIKAAKKNPDKIRNLKVTGQITTEDFYFMRDSMAILEAINLKEVKVKDDIIPNNAFYNKETLVYFSFPEVVTLIGDRAFSNTTLSGALVLPDDVVLIGTSAFYKTKISSVTFGNKVETISGGSFQESTLSGELHFPESLKEIGSNAFRACHLSGRLVLPDKLEHIEGSAFNCAGVFTGDLIIPEKITTINYYTFAGSKFTGNLILNNATIFYNSCFDSCGFTGDLIIPEGVVNIQKDVFYGNSFSSISLPSTLRSIESGAFDYNTSLSKINFPEGLVSIGSMAFRNCPFINCLNLPSSLQTIEPSAFNGCYGISKITCLATEPPTIQSGAFDGVPKDNFAVEVPQQSVIRYQTEAGWSDFKRVTAHYDFSIERQRMRALNAGIERTYVLRCPAGYDWSVDSKPEWVEISPSSGTGKTDVTVTVKEMPRTSEKFEINEGSFQYPSYKTYTGRSGEVVFKINENGYTDKLTVEQYDCDYADGDLVVNQTASKGPGIDIVFIGEGYDARDIASGKFLENAADGYRHFFNVEPYSSYKDYFNVSSIVSLSDESGIETVNTVIENKFIDKVVLDVNACFSWVKKALPDVTLNKSVVILLENVPRYYGWTYMYADGSALSVVPISQEAYPYDFRGLVQHEAGGHAFGKLGDEYIYHNEYISICGCDCCSHDGELRFYQSLGWHKNLSLSNDVSQAPWGHLVYDPRYSNVVDFFEGGYFHTRGVYRSEMTSCMNNNIPYFSAISRQAIVERIKEYAGEEFSLEDFYAKDSFSVGTKASSGGFDRTFGVDPLWNMGREEGSVIYMGDHPEIK